MPFPLARIKWLSMPESFEARDPDQNPAKGWNLPETRVPQDDLDFRLVVKTCFSEVSV